jgi:hypothetical protein
MAPKFKMDIKLFLCSFFIKTDDLKWLKTVNKPILMKKSPFINTAQSQLFQAWTEKFLF